MKFQSSILVLVKCTNKIPVPYRQSISAFLPQKYRAKSLRVARKVLNIEQQWASRVRGVDQYIRIMRDNRAESVG